MIDPYKNHGEVIAKCTVEEKQGECYLFTTTVHDAGHRDLCCLLRSNKIRGHYIGWLEAVESGDPEALEKERNAGISFECDLIKEGEELGWKVKIDERFMEMEINL